MPVLHIRLIGSEPTLQADPVAGQAVEADQQLIAFALPSTPESVRIARFRIRAALGFYRLGGYVADTEIITSELVTNAIQHACGDDTEAVGVILMLMRNPEVVTIVVTDPSQEAPVKRAPSDHGDRGRGLLVVDELSVCWGWILRDGGKAVYAILAKEASA
jgi:hypothetical protein